MRYKPKTLTKGVCCPLCVGPSVVIRTRRLATGKVARRRECSGIHCGHRFTTHEEIVPHAGRHH